MSRILRRPMFRGGSTNNEGIMSVPRKKYEEAGFVNEDELAANENLLNSGTITTSPTGLTISDSGVDLNKIDTKAEGIKQKYKAFGKDIEVGSYGDLLMKEYLGNRPDPMGKFLINFGLNYMSARPKGGKFGALATAAESAKKPTEQLYADIDTDRLLKLKLMSAIGKSDSKVALEKEARLLVEQYPEKYPDMKTALAELMRIRAEKKTLTPDERIAAREKSFELDQPLVKRAKAKLFEFGLPKLGKEEKNVDMNNTFINQGDLVKKQNSTDAQLVKPPQNIEKTYKTGKIYIDLESRNAYKYVGPNTFRFVAALEE
jgi:hypothetical protein